jgi:hypothetical protein
MKTKCTKSYIERNIEISTVGTTGINASGEETSTLRFTLMQVASLKEEAPSFRWE